MGAKKIFLASILAGIVLFPQPLFAETRNIGENYQHIYHIIDVSGNHVTGQTVTLQIKKVSNGYWLDFNDSTFKNTGWSNKTTNLSEDATNGFYYFTFTPPASETAADQYQFLIDNASADYGDHQSETVQYLNVGTSTFNPAVSQVTVAANNDKTGYSLTQTFPTNFPSLSITAGGAVTVGTNGDKTGYTVSTVQDKTGYSLSQSFPSNFADLAITASTGRVTVGTNADKAGYTISGTKTTLDTLHDITAADVWSSVSRTLTSGAYSGLTAGDVDAIWDEAQAGHATPGTFGKYLDVAVSSVGGSTLTASDVWTYASRTLTAGAYAGLTAADVDSIWNELLAGHTTAGSVAKTISSINDATNGEKEGSVYTGIENTIRTHGR